MIEREVTSHDFQYFYFQPQDSSSNEGSVADSRPITEEPVSASAQMPANVRYLKVDPKSGQASGQPSNK